MKSKQEIRKYLKTNENGSTTFYLWDESKAVLRGNFIEIQSFLKKQTKNPQIIYPTTLIIRKGRANKA